MIYEAESTSRMKAACAGPHGYLREGHQPHPGYGPSCYRPRRGVRHPPGQLRAKPPRPGRHVPQAASPGWLRNEQLHPVQQAGQRDADERAPSGLDEVPR